jgi:hypothetical protein
LSRFRHSWETWGAAQKIAATTLLIAVGFELTAWDVFPFNGYDSFSHIFWIGEWHKLWQAGIYYPRWLPDSFHGFGAPSFYYYPPLTFFLSSTLYVFLPDTSSDEIGKILGILAFALSGWSMWLYLRWRSNDTATSSKWDAGVLLGALLYAFAPYRIFNYATRGALPEHIAFCIVPFVFWGADLMIQKRGIHDVRRGIVLLILSFALLILTNLPAATVAGLGVFLYLAVASKDAKAHDFGLLAFGAIASMLLTAFYLLPVVTMFGNVQLERLWRPVPLVQSSPFLAIFTGEALTINSYTFVMLVGACILLIGWIRTRNVSQPVFWLVVFIVAAQLPILTQYLYRYIPPFTIVQLASRFSILLLIIIAIAWQDELSKNNHVERVSISSVVVIFWSICTIVLVGLQLADVHIHKHGPLPISDAPEYATRWAKPYYMYGDSLSTPFANDSQVMVLPSKNSISVISSIHKLYSDTIDYAAPIPSQALLRRSYWPTWKAFLDGKPIASTPDSLGRLTLTVPSGKHQLILWLETSTAAMAGSWISISTFLALIAIWIFNSKYSKSKS